MPYFPNIGWVFPPWYPQQPGWVLGPPRETKLMETPNRESVGANPDPVPWSVAFLVSAASSIQAATNMTNKGAAQQILAATNQAIAAFLDSDDICPPWPWPGPPPWLSIIASELTLFANTLQEGSLRTGVLQIAGQVLDRAQALATGKATAIAAPGAGA
jgi:hypothetical protein